MSVYLRRLLRRVLDKSGTKQPNQLGKTMEDADKAEIASFEIPVMLSLNAPIAYRS
jgi:hypothetical protein